MRVEIMNQDRLTADDHEGYVEWVGEGLAAFADCRSKLGNLWRPMLRVASAWCSLGLPIPPRVERRLRR